MPNSEYGGTPGGGRRHDGTTRHVGQVEAADPPRASERARSLKLSGDASGTLPVDQAVWEGWDRQAHEDYVRGLPAYAREEEQA